MAAAARRARSAERGLPGPHEPEVIGRLADILEQMLVQPRPAAQTPFKAPSYDGNGDIDYFIRQFEAVADANGWNRGATLLHLREALKAEAQECGRPETLAGIYAALRARYGLTPREARTRLAALRKEHGTPLQAHATEIGRLMGVAYADLPAPTRTTMALEVFASTLGNAYLQRHLLAVDPVDLDTAVRAGNEFLQVKPMGDRRSPNSAVRTVEEESLDQVQPVAESEATQLTRTVAHLVEQVSRLQEQLQQPARLPTRPQKERRPGCWGCGKQGHDRRECPTHPWTTTRAGTASGNDQGPQQ